MSLRTKRGDSLKKLIAVATIAVCGIALHLVPTEAQAPEARTADDLVYHIEVEQTDEREAANVADAQAGTGRWEVTPIKTKKKLRVKKKDLVPCSDSEFIMMTQVVYAESGNQGEHGMRLVADCIINQWRAGIADSIYGVLTYKNNFATVRGGRVIAHADEVTDLCRKVCREELKKQTDTSIMFFRTDHYHPFGTPCYRYKAHYFSRR